MLEASGSLYLSYVHRLATTPKTDDALAQFGEDLEHDSENGALSAAEQDKLVRSFLLKLVAASESSEEPSIPRLKGNFQPKLQH